MTLVKTTSSFLVRASFLEKAEAVAPEDQFRVAIRVSLRLVVTKPIDPCFLLAVVVDAGSDASIPGSEITSINGLVEPD